MNQDLLERYLYAVTRGLPKRQREDVAQELRGLVEDMLLDRCGKIAPTEKDLRVVLTELGTPQELYEKYSGEAGKCLIGQPYYSTYKLVLSIVLICAGVGITIANGILLALETQNAAQAVLWESPLPTEFCWPWRLRMLHRRFCPGWPCCGIPCWAHLPS